MVLKTFNIEAGTYDKFSQFCKSNGMSMSKQVDFFMKSIIEEPKVKKSYIEKIENLRKQKMIPVGSIDDFRKRYNTK